MMGVCNDMRDLASTGMEASANLLIPLAVSAMAAAMFGQPEVVVAVLIATGLAAAIAAARPKPAPVRGRGRNHSSGHSSGHDAGNK